MSTSPTAATSESHRPPIASSGSPGDTKRRILDAAEGLFADQGVGATSLRAIIAAAGVNSAAIHYHFGSKDALIEALFSRRITPINEERLARLGAMEHEGRSDHESLLRAFLEPMLGVSVPQGDEGQRARSALGRLFMEEPHSFRSLAEAHVNEVKSRFAGALAEQSKIGVEEATERIEYAMGAMLHAVARMALSGSETPPIDDIRHRVERMIRFLAAGFAVAADPNFRAPTPRFSA